MFCTTKLGKRLVQPYEFDWAGKKLLLTTRSEVLGYFLSHTIQPLLEAQKATTEDIPSYAYTFCKLLAVLEPTRMPYTTHVAYNGLMQDLLLSPSPELAPAVVLSPSIPKSSLRSGVQVVRYNQLMKYFDDFAQHIPTTITTWGTGNRLSLVGVTGHCYGDCAETLAWIVLG